MAGEPKTRKHFEEDAFRLLQSLEGLNKSVSYAVFQPLVSALFDAYQQGIADQITGNV